MIKYELSALLRQAIAAAQAAGELPPFDLPPVPIERPKDPDHGDYASPVAMSLARSARLAPFKIAEAIVNHLARPPYLETVEVARPGFINIRLSSTWLAQQVGEILAAGAKFGQVDVGQGRRVQVEFISANPTGPLTFGSGRNAVLGDVLAAILAAAGYQVQREYYLNDTGNQVQLFARTLRHRYAQALGQADRYPFPDDGYPGRYLIEMGQALAAEVGATYLDLDEAESLQTFRREGLQRMVARIEADAAALNIHFDRWFSEQSLYDDGTYDQVFEILQAGSHIVERDGALWLRSDSDDETAKDNVIVRSDGRPTYFASDIAYVYDKLARRQFDWAIYVWGADHHGHVERLKEAARALGLDDEQVTIFLYQLVALERDGKPVRMGKRSQFVTLAEVVEEIGVDATRFMLLTRSADSQMTLDLGLAVRQSNENPVYYVQYGHARIASILRFAEEKGAGMNEADYTLLTHPAELALIRQMLGLEETVDLAARQLAPHHLTFYAQELATAFHSFYHHCQVVGDDPALSAARLSLVKAAQITLANTLHLMGMSAPDRM